MLSDARLADWWLQGDPQFEPLRELLAAAPPAGEARAYFARNLVSGGVWRCGGLPLTWATACTALTGGMPQARLQMRCIEDVKDDEDRSVFGLARTLLTVSSHVPACGLSAWDAQAEPLTAAVVWVCGCRRWHGPTALLRPSSRDWLLDCRSLLKIGAALPPATSADSLPGTCNKD